MIREIKTDSAGYQLLSVHMEGYEQDIEAADFREAV